VHASKQVEPRRASVAHRPLGYGQVDDPAQRHCGIMRQFIRRAHEDSHDHQDEHLRRSAEPDRVSAGDPAAMALDVPAQNRREAENDRHEHRRRKNQARGV